MSPISNYWAFFMGDLYEKKDFYDAAMAELANFPALAERVAIGDVTITQQFGAMAQMLGMLSMQIGLAETEPWTKARDSMVLADAAAKGILPFGQAPVYQINIRNQEDVPVTISAGRRLLDNKSRVWVVRDGATIGPHEVKTVTAIQREQSEFVHEVAAYKSFYQVDVPEPGANQYLLGVDVVRVDGGKTLKRIEDFNNIGAETDCYHLGVDEIMRLHVTFGLMNKFGYVPKIGDQLKIITYFTGGDIGLEGGSELTFEYASEDVSEKNLRAFSGDIVAKGAMPQSISQMREMAKYPSIYNNNAVYLGEFAYLVKRELNPFVFLSIWNERVEELVRKPDVLNINKLFIAFIKDDMSVAEAQANITRVIGLADDSYAIKFVKATEKTIKIDVKLRLSPLHDAEAVKAKVKLWLIGEYGRDSSWAKMGGRRINWQETQKGLRENVYELSDGTSDLYLTIEEVGSNLPEVFQYVDSASVTVKNEPMLMWER